MRPLVEWTAQALVLAVFAGVIGHFSRQPAYQAFEPGSVLLAISFSHAGAPATRCRTLTAEELAALPPNMRKVEDCPRERVPVYVEVAADDRALLAHSAPPSGLWKDGESHLYRKFVLPAGTHRVAVGMRDTARTDGFDYQDEFTVDLAPGSVRVLDFDRVAGRFVLH